MFDIRKIQEQAIFNAVKNESDEDTAETIVDHPLENNQDWVANTMKRLEEVSILQPSKASESAANAAMRWTKNWHW